MKILSLLSLVSAVLLLESISHAEVKVTAGSGAAVSHFTMNIAAPSGKDEPSRPPGTGGAVSQTVVAPADNDAATNATFTIVDGVRDPNGGDLAVLHDGRVPSSDDQPSQNFFFRAGTDGGRIQIDLGAVIAVKQVNTFSWHSGARAPQVYKLYAAEGVGFKSAPKRDTDPTTCGWQLIATVDTRPRDGDGGGQHCVAITDSGGAIGKFRYLLLDISRTEDRDGFGNTFYSEIDVIDANGPATTTAIGKPILKSFDGGGGKFHFVIDATEAPDLAEWSEKQLQPVVQEWYPKIVALLPSEGFQAPAEISLRFQADLGKTPAFAIGGGVSLNAKWFRGELDREARGSVVHEMVHVVQNYWRARRDPKSVATPGWIVEGIADYVRWFLYEPQSKGAEITKGNIGRANYDSSYRITANFLNWVTEKYDKDFVRKLNTAAREGRYAEQFWKDSTGKTVQELGEEWKRYHMQRLNIATPETNGK